MHEGFSGRIGRRPVHLADSRKNVVKHGKVPQAPQTSRVPSAAYAQSLHRWRWPSPSLDGSALPNTPSSASDGTVISWFPGSLSATAFATACRVVRPPGGADRVFLPATQGFYFRAFDGAVTLPAAGYDYGGNWASCTGGTSTR